mmetsp:Transcript_160703/g.283346  ORF Transcript_160703/g.283346 Transcript_160703/m.283346 type:complete len:172 (-) Transcript_160703:110-625(-)
MAMMCRDELVAKGIKMDTLDDWHKQHGRVKEHHSPVVLARIPSNRREASHLRLEKRNPFFGESKLKCGQQGWLPADSLKDWFAEFGQPIACDSDVHKYAHSLLRPAVRLDCDRKVARLSGALWRRRADTHLRSVIPRVERSLPPKMRSVIMPEEAGTGFSSPGSAYARRRP